MHAKYLNKEDKFINFILIKATGKGLWKKENHTIQD